MAQGKYYFKRKNSPFKDYPKDTIEKLFEAYRAKKPIREIISEFDLKGVSPKQFYQDLPYVRTKDKCENCGHTIYTKKASRTQSNDTNRYLCLHCHHDFTEDCECTYCITEREERFQREKTEYEKQSHQWLEQQNTMTYQPSEISLVDEVRLMLIYRNFCNEKGSIDFTNPQYYNNEKFIGVPREYENFISNLIEKKLLIPIGYPQYDSFESLKNKDGTYYFSLYYNKAIWRINIDFPTTQDAYFQTLAEKNYTTEEHSILWKRIYRYEILLYLNNQNELYFNGIIDLNLIDVYLDELMEHYSLAKAYALIYFTTTSCLKYIHKYQPNEKALRTRFLNLLDQNIEKNIGNPNLNDFNRIAEKLTDTNAYIIEEIFQQKKHYFHLKTKDLLQSITV